MSRFQYRIARTFFVILCLFSVAACAGTAEEGFISMFNGKDLTEWDGKPGWWWVEDGAITSQTTADKSLTTPNYLIWKGGEPGDFDMRFDFRIVGGNSGVQIRSKLLPDWDTNGYQADIEDGTQWVGCLFEHTRIALGLRGEKVVIDRDGTRHTTKTANSNELLKKIRKHEWNEYRILAQGSDIRIEINGTTFTEVTDRQEGLAAASGVIGLQVHPGPPMKIQFRNLRIKIMDGEDSQKKTGTK